MTWMQWSEELTAAAKRAQEAGDDVAFIVLTTKAAECAQIARLLANK